MTFDRASVFYVQLKFASNQRNVVLLLVPEGHIRTLLTFGPILVNSQLYGVDGMGSSLGSWGGSSLIQGRPLPLFHTLIIRLDPTRSRHGRVEHPPSPQAKQRRFSSGLNVSERVSGIQEGNTRVVKRSEETNVNGMKQ